MSAGRARDLFPALATYMVAIVMGAGAIDLGGLVTDVGGGLLLAGFGLFFGLAGAVVVLLPGALILRRPHADHPTRVR